MKSEIKFIEVTNKRAFKIWWSWWWRMVLFGSLTAFIVGFFTFVILGGKTMPAYKIACILGIIAQLYVSFLIIKWILVNKRYVDWISDDKRGPDFKIALITEEKSEEE